jgi:catalase
MIDTPTRMAPGGPHLKLAPAAPPHGARLVHAKGWGAFGSFTVTQDLTRFTRAKLFARIGKRTDMLMRFSAGEADAQPGAAGAARDVLGFSAKFYTEEGNWDLVGSNTPVFFVRDPLKFPEFLRTQKPDPATGQRPAAAMWDFFSRNPESLHQLTILFGDRGLPASPRFMNGYGGHTYSFTNEDGERFWVKFHCKTLQGPRLPANGDAAGSRGYQADLFAAIARGEGPKWRFCVQVMPEEAARTTRYDPFDLTKIWPQGDYPLHELGLIALDRNAEDEFADVEQAAFSPSNVVPGIGFSPDRMLQARIFSYADAHRARLGAQYAALPVNAPRVTLHDGRRDRGAGPTRAPDRPGAPPWAPAGAPLRAPAPVGPGAPSQGRLGAPYGDDDYTQPGQLFRLMGEAERQRLFRAIAAAMRGVPAEIAARQIAHFRMADPAYGEGVERARAADMAPAGA